MKCSMCGIQLVSTDEILDRICMECSDELDAMYEEEEFLDELWDDLQY